MRVAVSVLRLEILRSGRPDNLVLVGANHAPTMRR
jgi:hypothetical protein